MPFPLARRRVFASLLTSFVVAALAVPAGAGNSAVRASEFIDHYAGTWVLDSEFSDAACTLALDSASVGHGYRIDGLNTCKTTFPVLAAVVAWEPRAEGGLAFLDGSGAIVVDYAISETESLLSVEPQHVFQRLTFLDHDSAPMTVGSITPRKTR